MNINELDLNQNTQTCYGYSPQELSFPADILDTMYKDMDRLVQEEIWNPEVKAKKWLFYPYLNSRADEHIAQRYLAPLMARDGVDLFMPSRNKTSVIFGLFYRFCQSNCNNPLYGVTYSNLVRLSELFRQIHEGRRDIYKGYRNVDAIRDLFLNLLNGGYNDLMRAALLYCSCITMEHEWTPSETSTLNDRMLDWHDQYMHHYDETRKWVSKHYNWYSDKIRKVVDLLPLSVCSREVRYNMSNLIDLSSLTDYQREMYEIEMFNFPSFYTYSYSKHTFWDALYAYLFAGYDNFNLDQFVRFGDDETRPQQFNEEEKEIVSELKTIQRAYNEPIYPHQNEYQTQNGLNIVYGRDIISFYCMSQNTLKTVINNCYQLHTLAYSEDLVQNLIHAYSKNFNPYADEGREEYIQRCYEYFLYLGYPPLDTPNTVEYYLHFVNALGLS